MSRKNSGRRLGAFVLLAALLALPFAGLGAVLTARPAGAAITSYTDGSIGNVGGMVSAPDGGLWFTNRNRDSIGRMDAATHQVTAYTGTGISSPTGIALGPDGALWFTNSGNDSIGRLDTSTHAVTNFTGSDISGPFDITAGTDGALWFTNQGDNSIGTITTAGVTHRYTNVAVSTPSEIVSGPDGALWYANTGLDSIGRVTTDGSEQNVFSIGSGAAPVGLAVGPDGDLWATNTGNNKITRMNTNGDVTNVYTDASISTPVGITLGLDGALWFANSGNGTIGRITNGGSVTSYSGDRLNPTLITKGPDGALWFANPGYSNVIGRITTPGVVSSYHAATISSPAGIATGSDGALWFTNGVGNSIGRIDPVTHAVTSFTGIGISNPFSIAQGADGAMWFTNFGSPGSIGRIDVSGTVTNYSGGTISGPLGITAGPDGGLWFTNAIGNSIGRIDPVTHAVLDYPDPSIDAPHSIAAGPDGKLWFTNQGSGSGSSIGRITTDGSTIDNFPDAGIQVAFDITAGPDGEMWFTDYGNGGSGAIGRIDTDGHIHLYPDARIVGPYTITAGADGGLWFANAFGDHSIGRIDPTTYTFTYVTDPTIAQPIGISSGPDGALWFTNQGTDSIGRLTATGGDVTRYGGQGASAPGPIIAGPDGAMWFSNGEAPGISRMTTAGVVTNHYDGAAGFRMAVGSDNAIWFTDSQNNRIGRISMGGAVTYYTDATVSNPAGIAAGPDNALWFVNRDNDSIGRLDPNSHVFSNYTAAGVDQPFDIVAGPDGALWFNQDYNLDSIGRITTSGVISIFTSPHFQFGGGLAAGPDGGLWVANTDSISRVDPTTGSVTDTYSGPNIDGAYGLTLGDDDAFYYFTNVGKIGRITTDGTSTAQADPNLNNPSTMTAGPDGAVWYTNVGNNSIGRADAGGVANAPTSLAATAGNGQVALTWTAPANTGGSAITDYSVSVFDGVGGAATGVTGASIRSVGSAATNYMFSGLTNGTAYTFKVAAVNTVGTGTSASSMVQTPGPFNVPARISNPGSNGYDTGYTVNAAVKVSASGNWCPSLDSGDCNDPDGTGASMPPNFLLQTPGTAYALVGRIGTTGPWTLVGSGPVTLTGNGRLYLAMNDIVGQFNDNMGAVQVGLDALNGVTGTNAPVSAQVTSGYDAAWSIPIVNDGIAPLTGVTATLHANANGPVPLTFHDSLMPGCVAGGGNSEVCTLPNIPAQSTYYLNAYVPTTGLGNGRTITGTVSVSASGGLSASGTLGTVTVVTCGSACVKAVAPPGQPVSSSAPPATPAAPPQQTVTLPATQAGTTPQPVAVTLSTITPSPTLPAADQKLCPQPTVPGQTQCSGKISSVVANFSKYKDAANPIRIKIVTNWGAKVPPGRILMEKDSGGDPLFLLGCVRNATTLKYNVPCVLTETRTGTAAAANLMTTNVILLTGVDVHFARRAVPAGTVIKPPAAPTAVTVTPGLTKAMLKWTAPTVTNGAGVTNYVVTALVGGVVKKTVTFNEPATTQTITGLVNGTTYTFKVAAKNVAGTGATSAASAAVAVGGPGAPTGVTAQRTASGSIKVTFVPPTLTNGAAVSSYTATCTSTNAGVTRTKVGTASPLVVTALTPGKSYRCNVKARNSRGFSSPSANTAALTA